ncbi:Hypothetical predicted protein [Mytilus galloprovincialis]|uniref:Uncharacterized protein n=1 Tax=Mytilus galloprovincialis TaxID=29158 RepID=A0A8B6BUA4_MYTGA|nr:Hypothetical predicted protein [Mytilus galloprovincialis]
MFSTAIIILGLELSTTCLVREDSEVSHFKRKITCQTNDKFKVDCTGKNLSHIPMFPNSTKTLVLARNKIKYIPEGIFSAHIVLEDLDVSHNILGTLMPDSFIGLKNLLRLNLQGNTLGENNSELPKICFKHLKKLRQLNFKDNHITVFPDLSLLLRLETLNATFTNKMTFGHQLKGLRFLNHFDLSSSSCKHKQLDKNTFQGISTLRYLDVSNNSLNSIGKGTFAHMQYLYFLDISNNPNLGLRGLGNVTNDLSHTSIEIFKFQKLVPTFSMNQMLLKEHLAPLNVTKLREIYVDSNRIQQIELGAISNLPKTIDKISIGDNQLSYGLYLFEFLHLSATIVNVSYLGKSHLPVNDGMCVSILSEKNLEQTLNEYNFDSGTQHVSTVSSQIIVFNAGLKLDIWSIINLPKNLTVLYYVGSKTEFEIPRLQFSDNVLEKADFSSNIFYSLKGPIVNMPHLHELDLSNNFCSNISYVFFNGTPNIRKLQLQNNL